MTNPTHPSADPSIRLSVVEAILRDVEIAITDAEPGEGWTGQEMASFFASSGVDGLDTAPTAAECEAAALVLFEDCKYVVRTADGRWSPV